MLLRRLGGQASVWTLRVRLGSRLLSTSWACAKKKSGGGARPPLLPAGWEAVIGVECHAQLRTPTKLFSGYPGTLPSIQEPVVHAALQAALALQCTVAPTSTFDRKHYFYADLPLGYQITQKYAPFAHSGAVRLRIEDGYLSKPEDEVVVPVTHIQLEQDTAKSSHFQLGAGESAAGHLPTYLDFNRAGVALIEIVSEPAMRTPEQAGAYIRKLRDLLRHVGASDGNMNEGSLRCDVNVSVHKTGTPFGVRTELKNLNSAKFVMQAIEYEVRRQHACLERGEAVEQESRGFNEAQGTTYSMRSKEDAPDYRYMPDANLPPLHVPNERVEQMRAALPELPDARHDRLRSEYALSVRDVNVLTRINAEDDVAAGTARNAVDFFEELVRLGCAPQAAVNWTTNELMRVLNAAGIPFAECQLPAGVLVELLKLTEQGVITAGTARELLTDILRDGAYHCNVRELVRERGVERLATEEKLRPVCEEVIAACPAEAERVRKGHERVLMKLVGEVMRRTGGRADAPLAQALLSEQLRSEA